MKFLKTTITSLILLSSFASAVSFEQQGVKEGNDRLSITLLTSLDDNSEKAIDFDARYGRFLTDNIELLLTGNANLLEMVNDINIYTVGAGVNYYFAKTPILTPYIGMGAYYYNYEATAKGITVTNDLNGGDIHLGTHYFFNENVSLTPVAGAQFLDFTDYSQSYMNIYLTYFFN